METIAKITKYSYVNKIGIPTRHIIADYYEQGYAVSNISKAFLCTPITIIHHLKALGIFEKNHKVKERGIPPSNHLLINFRLEMFEEDRQKNRIINQKRNYNYIQHKHLLADRIDKFDKDPIKTMHEFYI